jgi:hypothetical protein
MSFIQLNETAGRPYEAGYFLAEPERCLRLTKQAFAEDAVTASDGSKYIPMGTLYTETHTETVEGVETEVTDYIGFVYEDVDVSTGDMPCSVVVKGVVYEDRLPAELTEASKTALVAKGFVFITEGGEE